MDIEKAFTEGGYGSNGSTTVMSLEDFDAELPEHLQAIVDENSEYTGWLVQLSREGDVALVYFDHDDEMRVIS